MDSKISHADLTQYFPPLSVCQPWKTQFFVDKLHEASDTALQNLERYESRKFLRLFDL